jgi:hypothetical protein
VAVTWKKLAYADHSHDHGGLAGLGDDDHTQYLKLAGRDADLGQTIAKGLTVTPSDLTTVLTAIGNSSLQYPILSIGGSAGLGMWKDITPTKAWAMGMATPGVAITNDLIFSHYAGAVWGQVAKIDTVGTLTLGASFPYTFTRNLSTGYLDIQGSQSGNTGYKFLAEDGGAFLTMIPATGVSSVKFTVSGTKSVSTGVTPIDIYDSVTTGLGVGGGIAFYGNYTGLNPTITGLIHSYKEVATDGEWGFALAFHSRLHGEGYPSEKMRLAGTGILTVTSSVDSAGCLRATAYPVPTAGVGIEVGYINSQGFIQVYDRTNFLFKDLVLGGLNCQIRAGSANNTILYTMSTGVGIGDNIFGPSLVNPTTMLHVAGVVTIEPGSATPPIVLGANGQGQLVIGLNADKLDGNEATAFAAASHSHASNIVGDGVAKITVGIDAPVSPTTGDLWVDTN